MNVQNVKLNNAMKKKKNKLIIDNIEILYQYIIINIIY